MKKAPFGRTVLLFWGEFRDLRVAVLCLFWLIPGPDTGNQGGIPDSAESGQPARLDRAGSQTRTRLSPAGGSLALR